MSRRYRRFSSYHHGRYRAARHISERKNLSLSLGGIDKDVEQIFLNLPFVTSKPVRYTHSKLRSPNYPIRVPEK